MHVFIYLITFIINKTTWITITGPVQGTMADRRSVLHGSSRRSPRPSDSRATVDWTSTAQRTYRRPVPVSEHRMHAFTAAVVTSAAANAAAAARRVDRPRLAHPCAEQTATGSRAVSPTTATTQRLMARPNRSSELRIARRDTGA